MAPEGDAKKVGDLGALETGIPLPEADLRIPTTKTTPLGSDTVGALALSAN
jgi:hypothetical protein